MIYVISEPRLVSGITVEDIKAGRCVAELCIKIGFTTNLNNRFNMYMTNTPRFDSLYIYEEGTEEDEKRLHKYFEKYQPGDLNGKEWFIWDKEIINFFETNTTIELVREALDLAEIKLSSRTDEIKKQRKFIKLITPLINLIINLDTLGWKMTNPYDYRGQFKELHRYFCRLKSISNIFGFLEASGVAEHKISQLAKGYDEYLIEEKEELKEFERLTQYTDKMKYVCELKDKISEVKFNHFLNSIPANFKNYYLTLGPTKCKARKYQKGEMEKEYQRQLLNHGIELDTLIYNTFTVGEKITLSQIKERLTKAFGKVGYTSVVKATNINYWFDTKKTQITDKESGKRSHGLELLRKKSLDEI